MNPGIVYAAGAFTLWGLAPLYFKQLAAATPVEIVLHRSVWSLAFMLIVLGLARRWAWWGPALKDTRQLGLFALSAALLTGNWTLYVWAVNSGRVLDASLGYFINPLVNVLLGWLVLHERLRRGQWAAVALAAAGVAWLTAQAGQLPWIALTLAATFGIYGLLRKTANLGALEGLAMETLLMALVAGPLLVLWTVQGRSDAVHAPPALWGWLVLAGPVTAVPLLLFAAAARRVTLATLGLMQYIGPTIGFALGVWVFHEPFDATRLAGFALIWTGLAVYSAEGWWRGRQPAPASARA